MIRFATLAAAAVIMALAAPAAAAAAPVPAQAAAAAPGMSPEAVRAWLISKGGTVSEIRREGTETWLTVSDGPLNWMVFFYSCETGACGDIQYAASFSNPTITQDMVNVWNRDHRFLKAFFAPGEGAGDQTAVVQYDVLLQSAEVEQLTDHTALWLDLLTEFGRTVGFFAPAG